MKHNYKHEYLFLRALQTVTKMMSLDFQKLEDKPADGKINIQQRSEENLIYTNLKLVFILIPSIFWPFYSFSS